MQDKRRGQGFIKRSSSQTQGRRQSTHMFRMEKYGLPSVIWQGGPACERTLSASRRPFHGKAGTPLQIEEPFRWGERANAGEDGLENGDRSFIHPNRLRQLRNPAGRCEDDEARRKGEGLGRDLRRICSVTQVGVCCIVVLYTGHGPVTAPASYCCFSQPRNRMLVMNCKDS